VGLPSFNWFKIPLISSHCLSGTRSKMKRCPIAYLRDWRLLLCLELFRWSFPTGLFASLRPFGTCGFHLLSYGSFSLFHSYYHLYRRLWNCVSGVT
jgi:hypothetical protein